VITKILNFKTDLKAIMHLMWQKVVSTQQEIGTPNSQRKL